MSTLRIPYNKKIAYFILCFWALTPSQAQAFRTRDAIMIATGSFVAGVGITFAIKSAGTKDKPKVTLAPWIMTEPTPTDVKPYVFKK